MGFSLDPTQNPILRLYSLFDQPGIEAEDSPYYLGIENLRLGDLGGEKARELIRLLCQTASSALRSCRLTLDGQPVVNLAAHSAADVIEQSTIAALTGEGRLNQDCSATLSEWEDLLAAHGDDEYWPPGGDPFADYAGVLDELIAYEDADHPFALEISLEKIGVAEEHLLAALPETSRDVSVLVWRRPESMQRAFDGFEDFLEYITLAADRPIILFFNDPVEPYLGDFFKVFALADTTSTMMEQLQAVTPQLLAEYKELHTRHEDEDRPRTGRLDLPPALFLRQRGHLPTYPDHPLFLQGPVRSLLTCALLAWLAERTEQQDGSIRFTLPSGEVAFVFSMTDVQHEGSSIFETKADWQSTLRLLTHEIQRSVGRESRRALWTKAVGAQSAEKFTATQFFKTLKEVHETFIQSEREPLEIGGQQPYLELRIFYTDKSKGGGQIDFELSSQRLNLLHKPVGSLPVGEDDPKPWVGDLSRMAREYLTRILKPDEATPSALPDVDDLEAWGRELWADLIPKELKEHYVRFRKEKDLAILIVSHDPAFPWELVMPYAKKGELASQRISDPWLAVKFDLARWLAGGGLRPASQIGLERVCCVAATSDLTSAARELEFFQTIGVELATPQTQKELRKLLGSKQYDVIHFSCHGKFDKDNPDDAAVLLPDGSVLEPRDLRTPKIEEKIGQSRPLIFLNACHSGQAGPTMTGLGGWVEHFVGIGCGAFIGCGWEVSDPLAAEFAVTFYERFRSGETLARAVRSARLKIKAIDEANSTWLAYYLYGDPYCRLRESS